MPRAGVEIHTLTNAPDMGDYWKPVPADSLPLAEASSVMHASIYGCRMKVCGGVYYWNVLYCLKPHSIASVHRLV